MKLSVTDAAKATGIAESIIRRDAMSGHLTVTQDCRGHWQIDVMGLLLWACRKMEHGHCAMYPAPWWPAGYILNYHSDGLNTEEKRILQMLYDARAGSPDDGSMTEAEIEKMLVLEDTENGTKY